MTTDPSGKELGRHSVPHGGKNGREAERVYVLVWCNQHCKFWILDYLGDTMKKIIGMVEIVAVWSYIVMAVYVILETR